MNPLMYMKKSHLTKLYCTIIVNLPAHFSTPTNADNLYEVT